MTKQSFSLSVCTLIVLLISAVPSFGQPKIIRTSTSESAAVSCSLKDRDGNLWFGVFGEGIYRYNPANEKEGFVSFTIKDGLISNHINAILEDQSGNIWLGGNSGFCKYTPQSKVSNTAVSTFTPVPLLVSQSTYFQESSETTEAKRDVSSLIQDTTGRIWIGTNDGVFYFNPNETTSGQRIFTQFLQYDYTDNQKNLKLVAVTSMMEDRTGNIWFTTWYEGLCCYNGKSITNYTPENKIWFGTIFEDHAGNLWLGSRDHGVYRYTPSEKPLTSDDFVNVFPNTEIFNACAVPTITEDQDGNIWFGAEFSDLSKRKELGGLWCYHPTNMATHQKETFTNFTMKDGLPNNSVFDLIVDRSGKLWIGTREMGLCSYDTHSDGKSSHLFVHYTE